MDLVKLRRMVARAVVARIETLHYAAKSAKGDDTWYNEGRRKEERVGYDSFLAALEILTDIDSDTWDVTVRETLGESPTDNRLHVYVYEICVNRGFVEDPIIHS